MHHFRDYSHRNEEQVKQTQKVAESLLVLE